MMKTDQDTNFGGVRLIIEYLKICNKYMYIYIFSTITVGPDEIFQLHKMSEDYLELMRKNFESQFGKVDMPAVRSQAVEEPSDGSDSSEYSDFDGLMDDQEDQPIVVKHKEEAIVNDRLIDKQSKKAFMVGLF